MMKRKMVVLEKVLICFVVCLLVCTCPPTLAENVDEGSAVSMLNDDEKAYYDYWYAYSQEVANIWLEAQTYYKSLELPVKSDMETVVFAGDSIVYQMDFSKHFENVYNRGIKGEKIEGLSARIDSIAAMKPDKLFVLIGINNFYQAIFAENGYLDNYEMLFARIQERMPETKVYIQSILPINKELRPDIPTQKLKNVNIILELLTEECGFEFINLWKEFADHNDNLDKTLTDDGHHLSEEGREKYYSFIAPFIEGTDVKSTF